MQTHLLLCDIGNTTLKIGVADEKRVLTSYCLPVQNEETADSFGFTLLSLLTHARVAPDSILAAAISSVVPRMDPLVREAVSRYLDCPALFAPHDLPIPLENRYDRPEEEIGRASCRERV